MSEEDKYIRLPRKISIEKKKRVMIFVIKRYYFELQRLINCNKVGIFRKEVQ